MIKWVVRLAVIAGLLGLTGTIILIYTMNRKHEDERLNLPVLKKETLATHSKADTAILKPTAKKLATLTTAQPVVTQRKADTIHKILAPANKTGIKDKELAIAKTKEQKLLSEKTEKAAAKKEEIKANEIKKDQKEKDEKLFTQEELRQLVVRINASKQKNNISSNCVQLYSTKQGNNKRTIAQIETYLKTQRFAIAGREIIDEKVKGIQVSPNGGCIRITIGSF